MMVVYVCTFGSTPAPPRTARVARQTRPADTGAALHHCAFQQRLLPQRIQPQPRLREPCASCGRRALRSGRGGRRGRRTRTLGLHLVQQRERGLPAAAAGLAGRDERGVGHHVRPRARRAQLAQQLQRALPCASLACAAPAPASAAGRPHAGACPAVPALAAPPRTQLAAARVFCSCRAPACMMRTCSRQHRLHTSGCAALASRPRRAREGRRARRARTRGADGRVEGEEVRSDARAEHAVEQLQRLRGRPQRSGAAGDFPRTGASEPRAALRRLLKQPAALTRRALASGPSASGPRQLHSPASQRSTRSPGALSHSACWAAAHARATASHGASTPTAASRHGRRDQRRRAARAARAGATGGRGRVRAHARRVVGRAAPREGGHERDVVVRVARRVGRPRVEPVEDADRELQRTALAQVLQQPGGGRALVGLAGGRAAGGLPAAAAAQTRAAGHRLQSARRRTL